MVFPPGHVLAASHHMEYYFDRMFQRARHVVAQPKVVAAVPDGHGRRGFRQGAGKEAGVRPAGQLVSRLYFMRFQSQVTGGLWLAVILFPAGARAETPAVLSAANPPSAVAADAGLFGGLDARSAYQQEFFPQPLLVEDTGVEPDGELEFSSLHTQAGGQRSDTVMAGAQKSFGLLTFELGVPYEWNAGGDNPAQGVGNLEVSARYPVWQWVSAQGLFDDTFGVALEAGLPVNSPVSHNAELTPKLFNDVKLGEHFSVQSVFGYATLFGGGDSGGLQTFEYGFAFAYALRAAELPIPGVYLMQQALKNQILKF